MDEKDPAEGCCSTSEVPGVDPMQVCSLTSEELSDRAEWIRREIAPAVLGRRKLRDGLALEIVAAPGMAEKVDTWVELERGCCGSIRWTAHPSDQAGQIRVEIGGVDPNGSLFSSLPLIPADALDDTVRGVEGGGLRRLMTAGGFGTAISLFICCVLPTVLVVVFGATALAVPLARLDNPLWIGLGALVGGVLAWVFLGRRANSRRA